MAGVCCERGQEDQLHVHLKEKEKTRLALGVVLAVMGAGSPVVPELKWP